jgi:two-component system CheB/CheR fusion protein
MSTELPELHRFLLAQYAPPSVLIDVDGNILHLSDRASRFLRHVGGEPSRQLLALVLPDLRLELRTALFEARQTRKSVEARQVHRHSAGSSTFVNMVVRQVPGSDAGDLLLVLFDEVDHTLSSKTEVPGGSTRDLLLDKLEEELQSAHRQLVSLNHELKLKVEETGKVNDDLQNMVASCDIANVFIDSALLIKRYTPRATQIFSLDASDIGRPLPDIPHKLGYETLVEDAASAFQRLRTLEKEVPSSDGRWYLARMTPYRTVDDRIDGAVLTFLDITSRRDAEDRLHKGESRMRLVAESTKDYAIITLDPDGSISSFNLGAQRLFGYGDDEVLGQPIDLLFTPEDRQQGVPALEQQRARDEGRALDERWHQRKDGARFYCSGVMTPLFDEGTLIGYAKIARDLTGTKRIESEREALLQIESAGRAEALAASELKDQFLAVMSHELKNPLNLIQLNAELLVRMPVARDVPAVARAAQIIRKTVQSQAQIIDDLLDLSRMNTGKLALNREALDLAAAVRAIVTAMAGDAEAKQVALALTLPPEPVSIYADPVRVDQMAWNLLSNALKFTPAGGAVHVRVEAVEGFGLLEVKDTGRGIEASMLGKAFEMFWQADAARTRNERGLGIGLALVKHLADLHGGEVSAWSAGAGKGATFMVRLPLLRAGTPAGEATVEAERSQLAGLRVLVVDDEIDNIQTLAMLLELEGVEVRTATSAYEAVDIAGTMPLDLILSDIAMPEMDGYQLVEALRRNEATAALPVIALTGFGRSADSRQAIDAGFVAHLGKPVNVGELTALMARLFGRNAP